MSIGFCINFLYFLFVIFEFSTVEILVGDAENFVGGDCCRRRLLSAEIVVGGDCCRRRLLSAEIVVEEIVVGLGLVGRSGLRGSIC